MKPLYDILAVMYKKTTTTKCFANFWTTLFADFFAKIVHILASSKGYIVSVIAPLFFPTRCISCGLFGISLCTECAKNMTYAKTPEIPHSFAVFYYEQSVIKKAIHQLKFYSKSELAHDVTQAALPYIAQYIQQITQSLPQQLLQPQLQTRPQPQSPSQATPMRIVLIPSPLSKQRLAERGFNQSLVLAEWIQAGLLHTSIACSSITIEKDVITKERNTAKQSVMTSKQDRYNNIRKTMQAKKLSSHYDMDHTLFIIIDDVITTGATSTEAIRALQEAGALHVHTIALAHGKSL